MQESKVLKAVHTILMPYGEFILGQGFPLILTVTFEAEVLEEYTDLKVKELTGTDPQGRVCDMIHLVHDGSGEGIDRAIMQGILGNKKFWDKNYLWWRDEEPDE